MKLIYGVGLNDVNYKISSSVNGKRVICEFYNRWRKMLERCYCVKYHKKYATYTRTTVCDEWLKFSNFRAWMISKDWENKDLDKDIMFPGNKEYHPDKCVFVDQSLNKLLISSNKTRGDYPQGVSFDKCSNKYYSQVKVNGLSKPLGYYTTIVEARNAYVKYKGDMVIKIAHEQKDERIRDGLLLHVMLGTF